MNEASILVHARPAHVLSVAFAPYSVRNPYQTLLKEALQEYGVDITGIDVRVPPFALRSQPSLDILHIHWLDRVLSTAPLVTRILCHTFLRRVQHLRKNKVGIVWTVHNLQNHEQKQPSLEKRLRAALAHMVDAIIVHGRWAQDALLTVLPDDVSHKIHVIPHGNYLRAYPSVPHRAEAREKLHLPSQARVLLLFGFVRPYKGVLELIAAVQRLHEKDVFLLIAGEAQRTFALRVREAIAGDPRIRWDCQYISDDMLPYYFAASDAAVFPYHQSLTSGAIVLAMGFGCPCIAPRVGTFLDVLGDSIGILYEPTHRHGLEEALQTALTSDTLIEQGQAHARRARELDWEHVAQRTYNTYHEVLTGLGREVPGQLS